MNIFILDACSLLALLNDEDGAIYVESILLGALSGACEVYMHKVNLLEVYYGVLRSEGEAAAESFLSELKESKLKIISHITDKVFLQAAKLKAKGRISLADAILLAQSMVLKASVVTADHHEFDALEGSENLSFAWFR